MDENLQEIIGKRNITQRARRCIPTAMYFTSNEETNTLIAYVYMETPEKGVQQGNTASDGWVMKEFNKPGTIRRPDLDAITTQKDMQKEMLKQEKVFNVDDVYKSITGGHGYKKDDPNQWERVKPPKLKGARNARKRTNNPVPRTKKAKAKAKSSNSTEEKA